jgi:hypothetical protein
MSASIREHRELLRKEMLPCAVLREACVRLQWPALYATPKLNAANQIAPDACGAQIERNVAGSPSRAKSSHSEAGNSSSFALEVCNEKNWAHIPAMHELRFVRQTAPDNFRDRISYMRQRPGRVRLCLDAQSRPSLLIREIESVVRRAED